MGRPKSNCLSIVVVLAAAVSAFGQATFVGVTDPDVNGYRGWYDAKAIGTCSPGNSQFANNWGNAWCAANPPASQGPVGVAVNLNGGKVTALSDTTTSSLVSPAGTFLSTGLGTHRWGTFTNNGTVNNGRVVSGSAILATTINNNGTWIDGNPSSAGGTGFGNVTFNNNGLLRDLDAGNGIIFHTSVNPPDAGPVVLNNNTGGIVRASLVGCGINSFSVNNSGTFEQQGNGDIEFGSCNVTSTTAGNWNALGSGPVNVGFGFNGTTTLRGTFNGTGEHVGAHRLSQDIVIADDTTFNITGQGIYRWVCYGMTIAAGKTLTNTGVFQMLNISNLTGNFVNNGTWLDHGGTNLVNATIINNGTCTRDAKGGGSVLQPGTNSSTHSFVNNGILEAAANANGTQIKLMRFDNNGTVRNAAGSGSTMTFEGDDIHSSANASWNVLDTTSSVSGFDFQSCTIQGVFKGSTNTYSDWRINGSLTVADDTTFNITGGGITRWVANTVTIPAGKTLTNDGVFSNLNGWEVSGNIVNNGTWNLSNGSTTFNGHTFINNGTINMNSYAIRLKDGSSGNLLTNNGLFKVADNVSSGGHVLSMLNNGTLEIGAASQFGSQSLDLSQGDNGVVKLDNAQSQLIIPDNATLSGGTLTGNGTISDQSLAPVTVGKVILLPGDETTTQATLAIIPPTTLTADATVRVRVWGAGTKDMHTFGCARALALGGTLQLQFVNGFTPEVGQKWTVASGQSLTGKFDKLEVLNNPNIHLAATYDATSATIAIESITKPAPPADDDGDGVANSGDNCPTVANADQKDGNGNGVGDACESPAGSNPISNNSACGVGGCGAGAVTAMSMSLMSLFSIKRRRRR